MTYSETDLLNEVRAVRARQKANGQPRIKAWAVREVMAAHPDIEGPDSPFYVLCAQMKVADLYRRAANEDKAEDEEADPAQKTFAGWEHLQRSYLIDRDGQPTDIDTEEMSDAELLAKAEFFDKLSIANQKHAEEIRRYVAGRHTAGTIQVVG